MEYDGCTRICQSCAMPMPDDSLLGTDSDGSPNRDYCRYCYENGRFLHDVSMEVFIDMCSQFGEQAGMTNEQMREFCTKAFPTLKRWKRSGADSVCASPSGR